MKDYKFALEDVLLLIDRNGESEEQVILCEESEEVSWVTAPLNSKLIWTKENLTRKVESISVWDGKFQIWLADT